MRQRLAEKGPIDRGWIERELIGPARQPERWVRRWVLKSGAEAVPGFAATPPGIRRQDNLPHKPASILRASFAFPQLYGSYSV